MSDHFLVVEHVEPLDPDATEWDIEHPDSCPKIEQWEGVWDFNCGIGWELANVGRDAFIEGFPSEPGRYPIEHYVETFHHWELGPEVSSGILISGLS